MYVVVRDVGLGGNGEVSHSDLTAIESVYDVGLKLLGELLRDDDDCRDASLIVKEADALSLFGLFKSSWYWRIMRVWGEQVVALPQ